MFTLEQHLDNLVRHINLVQDAGVLLGKRLIALGRQEFGRILIGNVYRHDTSKFSGIEFDYLHAGKDVPREELKLAIKQHTRTNSHHPEFFGSFDKMPEIYIAEMACDLYARSQERGTSVRDWIKTEGIQKYNMDIEGVQYKQLMGFIDLLLEDNFVKGV